MRVVTTYNPNTWELFAKNNIESMVKHMEGEVIVYQEDPQEIEGAVCRDLFAIPDMHEVLRTAKAFNPGRGVFIDSGKPVYNYNYDVWKFCRKVMATADAAGEISDYLVWLDADVEVLQDFTVNTAKQCLNDNAIALYQRDKYHSETGIVIFNMLHPLMNLIMNRYKDLYTSGHIYQIPMGWHDAWALDACIHCTKAPVTNLSPALSEGLEVVSKSMLGPYFRHDKGNCKNASAS